MTVKFQTANIAFGMNSPFKKAYNSAIRITRTEGHRIQNQAQMDTIKTAKSKGADVVKQWDSTLDGRTRDSHRRLDGQIKEIDEPFEVGGLSAMCPGDFGDPAEDCNCRCCMIQRAKWALDESELKELKDRAAYFGLDKTDDFEEFKNKYLKAVENSSESGIMSSGAVSGGLNPDSEEAQKHANEYYESVRHMTTDVNRIAKNTGFNKGDIAQIKEFIFMKKHDLGGSEPEYFYPSYEMGQSWQRLIDGKNILPHDITLLQHEIMERDLMKQGYSQSEAHKITEQTYNYSKESKEYYAEINKHNKK